jgi:hypothetical protein
MYRFYAAGISLFNCFSYNLFQRVSSYQIYLISDLYITYSSLLLLSFFLTEMYMRISFLLKHFLVIPLYIRIESMFYIIFVASCCFVFGRKHHYGEAAICVFLAETPSCDMTLRGLPLWDLAPSFPPTRHRFTASWFHHVPPFKKYFCN